MTNHCLSNGDGLMPCASGEKNEGFETLRKMKARPLQIEAHAQHGSTWKNCKYPSSLSCFSSRGEDHEAGALLRDLERSSRDLLGWTQAACRREYVMCRRLLHLMANVPSRGARRQLPIER